MDNLYLVSAIFEVSEAGKYPGGTCTRDLVLGPDMLYLLSCGGFVVEYQGIEPWVGLSKSPALKLGTPREMCCMEKAN